MGAGFGAAGVRAETGEIRSLLCVLLFPVPVEPSGERQIQLSEGPEVLQGRTPL